MSFRPAPWRRIVVALALSGTVVTACGSDDGSGGDEATPTPQPSIAFPSTLSTSPPVLSANDPTKAAPRWEQVRVLAGNGAMDPGQVSIAGGAIQWRVRWNCDTGNLRITTTPPPTPSRPGPVVDAGCPGSGEGYGRQTGDLRLSVQASGPWKATVEQQLDTPIDEAPLPEMATARVLGKGDFYNVERTGKGTAILYQLADGRRALRLENGFEVFNDPDLVVWLSSLPAPKTSKEMSDGPHVEISALKSTRGSQNYIIPNDLPIPEIRSVGLFCVPVPAIYTAASLA